MGRSRGEHAKPPNFPGDPPAAGGSRNSRRRRHSTPKREHFDICHVISSWSSQQLSRLQPWDYFADPSMISIPRSAREMTHRIEKNADFFRTNYGIIFLFILAGCIVSSMVKVVSVMAVGAVCVALSLHKDAQVAFLFGRRLPLTKNQRVGVAAMAALPLLCAADIFSSVFWCLGVIMVIATAHASVHGALGLPFMSRKNVPENPGDPTFE